MAHRLRLSSDVYALARVLRDQGLRRVAFTFNASRNGFDASTPALQGVANELSASPDFLQHEGLYVEVGKRSGFLCSAALWKTCRGQGCGGIRLRPYDSLGGFLVDGMRLATGMGRKSALAGLWWGGGKGVIAQPDADVADAAVRQDVFRDYGEFVTGLRGAYVAAEDAGVHVADVDVVYSATRWTTCVSEALGGSGNPSIPTAHGIVAGLHAAFDHLGTTLAGKSVGVQGLGNVGGPMVAMLLGAGVSRVVASDASPARMAAAAALHGDDPRVELVPVDDGAASVLHADVDAVSPCGYGGALNAATIPGITAAVVCGAANNQLETVEDAGRLAAQGALYVPDFVVNRMGVVNCSGEQYGRVGALSSMDDPLVSRHLDPAYEHGIYQVTRHVLQRAADAGVTPDAAACELADAAAAEVHPLYGHRSLDIQRSLVKDGWAAAAV